MEQVFTEIYNALLLVLSDSFIIIPQLENATAIIAYILSVLLFLLFFSIPSMIFIIICKNCLSWEYDDGTQYSTMKKRKRRR